MHKIAKLFKNGRSQAHAFSTGLPLVTSDRSFHNLRPRLLIADWSKPR